MSLPIFPNNVESFYGTGNYYLGRNPIFNPFVKDSHLTKRERKFSRYPLLNYGMSSKYQLPHENVNMSPDHRFDSQIRLFLNTVAQLGEIDGKHLLEVGSGTGCGAYILSEEYHPASYNGVDFSEQQVKRARLLNIKNVKLNFHQMSAENIAEHFGNEQFDGIFSVEMIQHLSPSNLKKFIEASMTTLRPGGKISFSTFFSQKNEGQSQLKKIFPTIELGLDFLHNIQEIKELLIQTGFENVQVISIGNQVWGQLVRWCNQVAPEQKWSNEFLKAYPKYLDYYIVTGKKNERE